MYEYTPTYARKKELLTLATLVLLAGVAFVASKQERLLLPAVWQLLCVLFLTAAVYLTVRYLLRSYTYRIAPREDGTLGELDLTVIEQVGRRRDAVCRISLADIEAADPITRENEKRLRAERRGQTTFAYYAELAPEHLCLLTVRDREKRVFVLLQTDEKLCSILKRS